MAKPQIIIKDETLSRDDLKGEMTDLRRGAETGEQWAEITLLEAIVLGLWPEDTALPEKRIRVEFVHPPIPDRRFDYAASFEDGDEDSPVGYGPTRNTAIGELMQMVQDAA